MKARRLLSFVGFGVPALFLGYFFLYPLVRVFWLSLTGDGWAQFVVFATVLQCGQCEKCVNRIWKEMLNDEYPI